jgi:phosphoglucosamine mutase
MELFGTDGVRGVAGRDLNARLAMSLAAAAAHVLGGEHAGSARPFAVVGRDPRASGEFLEAAVVAGLAESGIDVLRLGIIPTPGVAYLTDVLGADFGVMLSASHNPAPDNGIKFFGWGGVKLPDEVEGAIEARMAAQAETAGGPGIPAAGFGRVRDAADESGRYLTHLLSTLGATGSGTDGEIISGLDGPSGPSGSSGSSGISGSSGSSGRTRPLAGWRVVVDCAHGAAYDLAPRLLAEAGAEVIAIGVEPDGININAGYGSTSLGALQAAVTEHGADAGIAYDGDADRCLAVDAVGDMIDGDQILAILALALKESGRLAGGTVVASVMANLGFRLAMSQAGIDVVETPVGDRHLIAAMLDGKFVLGGEQSGHIIMLDHASTGDGMLTSLQLLATAAASGRSLSELAAVMTRVPQVLVNVHDVRKDRVAESAELAAAVAEAAAELGESGRVLVRPSGTEPAVRVMVEAVDSDQAHKVADRLAEIVRAAR